jgi:hypothetical protein
LYIPGKIQRDGDKKPATPELFGDELQAAIDDWRAS